jgi:zinc transport system substrate-binding protein
MKQNRYIAALSLLAAVFAVFSFSGCTDIREDIGDGEKIIITTIVTTKDLTERIAGDKAEVSSLIPPGASPHSFEPAPKDLEMAGSAHMFVMVGSGLEFELEWAEKITGLNTGMTVVDCSRDIQLLSPDGEHGDGHEGHGADPHIWLSPVNARVISRNIYDGLIEIDPDNEEYYKQNLSGLLAELDALDSRISEILSGMENRKILVFHPAWTYFASEYGMEQIAVQEEGKEPTLKSMESLIKQAMDEDIRIIFASPEFDTKSAEVIASEIGGEVVLLSPLPEDYISDMEKIARAFEKNP